MDIEQNAIARFEDNIDIDKIDWSGLLDVYGSRSMRRMAYISPNTYSQGSQYFRRQTW